MSDCKQVRYNLSLLDEPGIPADPSYQPMAEHLVQCPDCRQWLEKERGLESRLAQSLKKPEPGDDKAWQDALDTLVNRMEQDTVRRRIKYFVSAASAALVLIALFGYMLFQPAGIPSGLLQAMESEHTSFVRGEAQMTPMTGTPDELSSNFRHKNLMGKDECCCALTLNNPDIRLKGGRTCKMDNCNCAAVYAYYKNTPVSFFIYNQVELSAQTGSSISTPGKIWTNKTGRFNAVIKRLPNCAIGVIGELQKTEAIQLLENIETLTDCKCNCNR